VSDLSPPARSAGDGGVAEIVALEVAALKADAQALRSLLSIGEIVRARVLPFNGLTDLIEILGKRVAAALPPTARPGDTLVLEVTGFEGDRIVVRMLGSEPGASSGAPEPSSPGGTPPGVVLSGGEEAAQMQISTHAPALVEVAPTLVEVAPTTLGDGSPPPPPPQAQPTLAPREGAADSTGPAADSTGPAYPASPKPQEAEPPSRSQPPASPAGPGAALPQTPSPQTAVARTTAPQATHGEVPMGQPGASPPHPRVTISVLPRAIETDQTIEARLIAARTPAKTPLSEPRPAGQNPVDRGPLPPRSGPGAAPSQAGAAGRTPLNPVRPPAWVRPSTPTVSTPAVAPQRTAQTYQEPVVLLRSLRIPVTPANVAAARLALETPGRVPVALAALERALRPLSSATADPRINTMRTIAAFIAAPDPRSETFPAQLSAYVGHVIDGPEPKLARLLQALSEAAGSPHQALPSAAKAAERAAAVDYDLKTQLQDFITHPPPAATPVALDAAQSALVALTAAQLSSAVQSDPRALAITLPLPFTKDGTPARIVISREKPESAERLDEDNFHIAFVLDTKNVGTVAIDLQTVGRAVSVSVKSETRPYAAAFDAMLGQLGGRLEQLRYTVVSLESEVVSRAAATVSSALGPAPRPPDDTPAGGVDLRA